MMAERQIPVALMSISAAILVPDMRDVVHGNATHVSLAAFIVANVLTGVGLLVGILFDLEEEGGTARLILKILMFGAIGLVLSSITFFAAWSDTGLRAFWLGVAALFPLCSVGLPFILRRYL